MPDWCVAEGCSNRGCVDARQRGITFHLFPKAPDRRRQWEVAIGRKNFVAKNTTQICSEHFRAEDFDRTGQTVRLRAGVVPSIFSFSAKRQKVVRRRTTANSRRAEYKQDLPPDEPKPNAYVTEVERGFFKIRRKLEARVIKDCVLGLTVSRLNSDAVPSLFSWNYFTPGTNRESVYVRCHKRQFVHQSLKELENQKLEKAMTLNHDYATSPRAGAVDEAAEIIQELEAKLECASIPTPVIISQFCASDAQIRFYTKLPSVCVFKIFWEHIAPSASRLIYWSEARRMGEEAMGDTGPSPSQSMTLINEFLMYSMRIAAGMKEQLLADMFKCSVAAVSRVIITWANYLFLILGTVPLWASREKVRSDMPDEFRKHCPNVRVILDCTEIAVTAPSSLTSQSEMMSHHKNRTVKALVGVTPHGFVSFFSQLYPGRVSDTEMTRLCGILQLLEPGDEVVADKGFVIEDLLSDVGAKLIISPSKSSAQSSKEDTEKAQAIARLRIVMERVKCRIKSNHIWDSPIPLALIGTVSHRSGTTAA